MGGDDAAASRATGGPEVRPASAADSPAIVDILVAAFHDDPVSGWVFPDPRRRRAQHRAMFTVAVEIGLCAGWVHRAGDAGAAIWLGRERPPDDAGERIVAALADASGSAGRFERLGELMDARHPDQPHAYLPFIGVVPDRQGQGVGGALLAHQLTTVDALGLPAYLEASAPRSRHLYRRHGYAERGEPIRLPDGPEMWPMWRPAGRMEGAYAG